MSMSCIITLIKSRVLSCPIICIMSHIHAVPHCSFDISAGIFKQSMGTWNRVGIELSYRPARLHRLVELIPWNSIPRHHKSLKIRLLSTVLDVFHVWNTVTCACPAPLLEYTVKKRFAVFPSPDWMSLTKLPLAGNNLFIPGQWEFGA
jgi:hypothetical protein